MYRFQKWSVYIIILLAITSIYHDLTDGSHISPTNEHKQQKENVDTRQFTVVEVKIESGDTFLSITEQLNDSLTTLDINKISEDFTKINHIDPHNIKRGTSYYFPLYK